MSRRGGLHWDEQVLRDNAAKRTRWQAGTSPIHKGIGNAIPVEIARTAAGRVVDTDATNLLRTPAPQRSKGHRPYFVVLMGLLRPYGIPEPRCEFRFDDVREWRFDFAWIGPKIALEIDGGLFINGGHNRGAYLLHQMEKQNAAVLLGWRVLRYAPHQLTTAARDVIELHGDKYAARDC